MTVKVSGRLLRNPPLLFAFLLAIFFLNRCGLAGSRGDKGGEGGRNPGRLYVANTAGKTILAYDAVQRATGETSPSRRIPDPLLGPVGVSADPGAKARGSVEVTASFKDHPSDRACEGFVEPGTCPLPITISACTTLTGSAINLFFQTTTTTVIQPTDSGCDASSRPVVCKRLIDVEAAVAGVGSNVAEGKLDRLAAPIQGITKVTNPSALAGGRAATGIYVTNTDHNSILVYPATGGPPSRTISGPLTRLNRPMALFLDPSADRLFIANTGHNRILIFDNASSISGDTAASREIGGVLTGIDFPRGIAYDPTRDLLYVSNMGKNNILIFERAASAAGDLSPARTIEPSGTATSALLAPFGIAVDPVVDRIYVANSGGASLLAFAGATGASAASGSVPPALIISGPKTGISDPAGVKFLRSCGGNRIVNERLIVANNGNNTVLFFDSPSQKSGSVSDFPDRIIGGFKVGDPALGTAAVIGGVRGGISEPAGVDYDPAQDALYVANTPQKTVALFTIAGNIPPGRKITIGPYNKPDGTSRTPISGGTQLALARTAAVDPVTGSPLTLERLFAAEASGGGALLIVKNPSTLAGDTTVTPEIVPASSQINAPQAVAYDEDGKQIFVLNGGTGALSVYDISNLTTPIKFIQGPNTFLAEPAGVGIDRPHGLVYVINAKSRTDSLGNTPDTITAYRLSDIAACPVFNPSDAAGTTCDLTPRAIISDPVVLESRCKRKKTYLCDPQGIAVDPIRDILYVQNGQPLEGRPNASIIAFESLSTRIDSCPAAPALCELVASREITGSATSIGGGSGLAMNVEADRLYAAEQTTSSGAAVIVFDLISGRGAAPDTCTSSPAACNVAPDRILSGARTLLNPRGLFLDSGKGSDLLYVLNEQGVNPLFISSFGPEGDILPARQLGEGRSTFIRPTGVAVDRGATPPLLIVADPGDLGKSDGGILIFKDAANVVGDALPLPRLCEESATCVGTGLADPAAIAVDVDRGLLFVANQTPTGVPLMNEVLVFLRSSLISPPNPEVVIPVRRFRIRTDPPLSPSGIAYDGIRDLLYISDADGNRIVVVKEASSANGEINPFHIFGASGPTPLDRPSGIGVDPARNLIYVASAGANAVLVFDGTSVGSFLPSSLIPPLRVLSGTATLFSNPEGLALDPNRDILYVANSRGNSVVIFAGASQAAGNITPTRNLTGPRTTLSGPRGLFFDPE